MGELGLKSNMAMSKRMYSRTKNIYSRTLCGVADSFTWTDPEQVKTISKLKRLNVTNPAYPEPFTDVAKGITAREKVDEIWTCVLALYRDKQKEMVSSALDMIINNDESLQQLAESGNENEDALKLLKNSFQLKKIYAVSKKGMIGKGYNIHFKYDTEDVVTFDGKRYTLDILVHTSVDAALTVSYSIANVDLAKES